jgi:IS30 family transposase
MEQITTYQHLQPEDRMTMASRRQQGGSLREMARRLGRSASTVSGEFRRNTLAALPYASHSAPSGASCGQARPARRRLAHRAEPARLEVVAPADRRYSQARVPDEPERHVSHEPIYTAIYAQPRGELRRRLIACLRQGRGTRMPRKRGTDRRGQIPDMVSIHVRPPEINDRVMPGHWE